MNIKDVELRTGMARANIRYYESLGLLSPARSENGYRDYSEEDIHALLKIKLLRSVEVSLEDIGALSRGETGLKAVLSRQLLELDGKEQELQQAKELCRRICSDDADYVNLDASYYLEQIPCPEKAINAAQKSDTSPKVTNYVLRFFARYLDLTIYDTLVSCIFLLGGVNISAISQGSRLLLALLAIAIMLFAEPLLLMTWGTTPGKWIMGVSVRQYNGEKLPYMDGLARTWGVICWGFGLFLPVYSIVRLIMSGIACGDGQELRWDDGCIMLQKDDKPLRWLPLIGAYALCFGFVALCSISAVMPDNRGQLTVEQFVENYNDAVVFDGSSDYRLTASGHFEKLPQNGNSYVLNIGGAAMPTFSFHEKEGIMTGFTLSLECSGDEVWPQSCASQIATASQSFIYGTAGGMMSNDFEELVDTLNERPFEDFYFVIRGYELKADYTAEGYIETGMSYLFPADDAPEHSYSLVFTLSPVE